VDILFENGFDPIAVNNGTPAFESDRYANWITEAWFNYKAFVRDGLASIPNDRVLINQLASRRYEFTTDGRLRLEPKERMKARGVPSPDRAEATMYGTGPVSSTYAVYGEKAAAEPHLLEEEVVTVPSTDRMGEF